jgi:hypothetical protein
VHYHSIRVLSFYQGGRPLTQGGRVSFTNTPNEIKLVNKAAEKSDSGKYNVVLSNEKGNDSVNINVNVVGK